MCPVYFWTPCRHFSQCIGWCPKCADEFLAKLHEAPHITIEVKIDALDKAAVRDALKRRPDLMLAIERAARDAEC